MSQYRIHSWLSPILRSRIHYITHLPELADCWADCFVRSAVCSLKLLILRVRRSIWTHMVQYLPNYHLVFHSQRQDRRRGATENNIKQNFNATIILKRILSNPCPSLRQCTAHKETWPQSGETGTSRQAHGRRSASSAPWWQDCKRMTIAPTGVQARCRMLQS